VIAVTSDYDLRHILLPAWAVALGQFKFTQEAFIMAPTAVLAETEVLSNQKTILQNQTFILKNQEEIKKNQSTLGVILKNQEEIKKNQETLHVIVKNQEKILTAVRH
jgi:hypothetical protein